MKKGFVPIIFGYAAESLELFAETARFQLPADEPATSVPVIRDALFLHEHWRKTNAATSPSQGLEVPGF